eukprot:TRINITY_DN4652_c0_g1_i1.p1 TRINITY_DN4652_c0_g1~~TRINITY_DN4652_c0_g1_i1.p1  ORF type:complete len:481 (+),score=86.69 TRINITY_DN4652_c0_g1_i1:104-1444(+)
MAAGPGSRMYPLSAKGGKALMPMCNIPLVCYALSILEKAQFSEVIMVAPKSAVNEILTHTEGVFKINLIVHGLDDGHELGTADVLRQLDHLIKTDFLVLSADTISNVPLHLLADVHRSHASAVTCLLAQGPKRTDDERRAERKRLKQFEDVKGLKDFIGLEPSTGRVIFHSSEADLVDTEGIRLRRRTLRNHPQVVLRGDLLDAHLYIFARWVIDYLKANEYISTIKGELIPDLVHRQFSKPKEDDSKDVFNFVPTPKADALLRADEDNQQTKSFGCYAYVVPAHTITKPHDDPNAYFVSRANTSTNYTDLNHVVHKYFDSLYPLPGSSFVAVAANANVEAAQFGAECIIGAGTEVGKSTLKRSIVGCHTKIGDKCKLTNCVILDHVVIEDGTVLNNCVVCSNALVGAKCSLSNCRVAAKFQVPAERKATNEAFDAAVFDSDSFSF